MGWPVCLVTITWIAVAGSIADAAPQFHAITPTGGAFVLRFDFHKAQATRPAGAKKAAPRQAVAPAQSGALASNGKPRRDPVIENDTARGFVAGAATGTAIANGLDLSKNAQITCPEGSANSSCDNQQ